VLGRVQGYGLRVHARQSRDVGGDLSAAKRGSERGEGRGRKGAGARAAGFAIVGGLGGDMAVYVIGYSYT
jgi:hypothetical protein